MLPPVSPDEAARRLREIFPRAAFDTVLSSPLAAAGIAALIYMNAVAPSPDEEPEVWARPVACLWMSDATLTFAAPAERRAWGTASGRSRKAVAQLLTIWGDDFRPWYGDNSREGLRDEIFKGWKEHGAILERGGLPTTSSRGRWALAADFAVLFDPQLPEDAFRQMLEKWRDAHMTTAARIRALQATEAADAHHGVRVVLPNGTERLLEPGDASAIIKGVIEEWAPRRLAAPIVLSISQPGDKVFLTDASRLQRLGIALDPGRLLPDVLIADALQEEGVRFWLVEAVATDGPIDERRRQALSEWAVAQGIRATDCAFLTAFLSRNQNAARRRLKDLATGTFAWFLDEPDRELAWYELP